MKGKIVYLIVGILIGAIVTAGAFMILNKDNTNAQDNFDRGNFRNFDPNNLPEDFDPNSIPEGGPGGRRSFDQTNANTL